MNTGRLVATVTALVASVAVADSAAAAPGFAVPHRSTATAQSRLTLTVATGEAAQPAQRLALLTCGPAGGTHKRARNACAALNKVRGDFAALQVSDGACTMQYQPVTVSANGRWKGKKVRFQHTYGNACAMGLQTGPVFGL